LVASVCSPASGLFPPFNYLPMYLSETVLLDLKGTDSDDNPVVQGKLIFHLSTISTVSVTSSRPTDSSLVLTSIK